MAAKLVSVKARKGAQKVGKSTKPAGDGRANPSVLDASKFTKFADGVRVAKVSKNVAQQVTGSAVTHHSGKGVAAYRESLNGTSKTALIRWLASEGYDESKAKRVVASLFEMMTPGVWAKNWSRGLAGDGVPELDRDSVNVVKQLAK